MLRPFRMVEPKVHVFRSDKVCVFTLEGSFRVPDIVAILERHYPLIGDCGILWNMAQADLRDIRDEDFADIAAIAAMKLGPSITRKTAYVAPDKTTFVRLCNYLNIAIQAHVPSEYAVFLDVEAARQWLARA